MGAMLAPLRPVWDAVAGGIRAVWGWVTRLLAPVRMTEGQLSRTTSAGQTLGRVVGGAISRLFAPITFLARLAGFVIRNWTPITSGFAAIFNRVGGFFAGLPARFMAFGANIIDGLVAGIRNGVSRVVNAAAEVGRAAASGAARALGIRSPSRVFARLGDWTMQGLNQGLERGQALPLARVAAVAAALAAVPFTLAAPVAEAATAMGRPAASAEAVTVTPVAEVPPVVEGHRPPGDGAPPSEGAGRPSPPPEAETRPVQVQLIGTVPATDNAPPPSPRPPAPPSAPMMIRQTVTQHFTVQGANLDVRAIARELKRLGDAGARGALNDGREP